MIGLSRTRYHKQLLRLIVHVFLHWGSYFYSAQPAAHLQCPLPMFIKMPGISLSGAYYNFLGFSKKTTMKYFEIKKVFLPFCLLEFQE